MSTLLEGPFDLHYPHLFDAIIHATSDDARAVLRLVSRNVRARVDYAFPHHLSIKFCERPASLTIGDPVGFRSGGVATSTATPRMHHNLQLSSQSQIGRPRLLHELCQEDGFDTTVGMTRILDVRIDSGVSFFRLDWVEFVTSFPHLHTVRHLRKDNLKDDRHLWVPAPRLIFFTEPQGRWKWENHQLGRAPWEDLHVGAAPTKVVINVMPCRKNDEWLLPNFDDLRDWTLGGGSRRQPFYDGPSGYESGEQPIKQIIYTLPFSFSLRLAAPALPSPHNLQVSFLTFSLLASLAWEIVYRLFVLYPNVTPVIVIRTDDLDLASEYDPKGKWTLRSKIEEVKRKLNDELLSLLAAMVPEVIEHENAWTTGPWQRLPKEGAAMIARLQVLSDEEYKARVGEYTVALETTM